MIDYYLRASDETAMHAALVAAGVTDANGSPMPGMDLSVIGTIVMDQVPLHGYHANLRTAVELGVDQLAVLPVIDKPTNPVRVWFDRA